MMKKYVTILPFTVLTCLMIIILTNSAMADEKKPIKINLFHGAITNNLYPHIGEYVIITLNSGNKVEGVLDRVGYNYSLVKDVKNPGEYFATVISNIDVESITFRIKDDQGNELPLRIIN